MDIDQFDRLSPTDARRVLHDVCAAPRWAAAVADGRPYGTRGALLAAAAAALRDEDLDDALAGHPRIGDRAAGGRSGTEQARVAATGGGIRAALAEGNAEYERRFGHVYLVCAAGRGAEDLLATLHARLDNDAATERAVALTELAAINRRRLADLLDCSGARRAPWAPTAAEGHPGSGFVS